MITYAEEKLINVVEELDVLVKAHWEEVSLYKDKVPLYPDYTKYQALEDIGSFIIYTARDNGKLIGYYSAFVTPHIHYASTVYAHNDAVYIDSAYRGTRVAYKLLSFAEKELKEIGAKVITLHMKVTTPFDRLCEALGYSCVERIYSKYIG